jgi:hypothetical protein
VMMALQPDSLPMSASEINNSEVYHLKQLAGRAGLNALFLINRMTRDTF